MTHAAARRRVATRRRPCRRAARRACTAAVALSAALAALVLGAGCSEIVAPVRSPEKPVAPGDAPPPPPRVLVANSLSWTISSLDLATGAMTVQAGTSGSQANRVVDLPERGTLLVVASGDNDVVVHDRATFAFREAIDVGTGQNPYVAARWGASRALVSNWLGGAIAEIDLNAAAAGRRLATTRGPEGVLVDGDRAYVACTNYDGTTDSYGEGRVDVVDLNAWAVTASVVVPRNPQEILRAPDGRIHVLCTGTYGGAAPEEGSVAVLDPASLDVVGSVPIGGAPGAFVFGSGGAVWVVGYEGGVHLYDPVTLASWALPSSDLAGFDFSSIAQDPDEGTLYLTSFSQDLLFAVDEGTGSVLGAWIVGDGPVHVVVAR